MKSRLQSDAIFTHVSTRFRHAPACIHDAGQAPKIAYTSEEHCSAGDPSVTGISMACWHFAGKKDM